MVARKKADASTKKENRIVRYLKEVRTELRRIAWPSQQTTINLTLIVLAVTIVASMALGFIDWLFTQVFAWIIT
jgi:preprotein translocase subunit SecE